MMDQSIQMIGIDCDLSNYGAVVSQSDFENNSLVYLPTSSVLNYTLLDFVRKAISSANGHILVIAPSEYAVKHHTQFLQRHLVTDSIIGSQKSDQLDDVWPLVIVTEASLLPDLYKNGIQVKFELVIILECHDAMHNQSVSEFIALIKGLEKTVRPKIHSFTSCLVPSRCEIEIMSNYICQQEEFYDCKLLSFCDSSITKKLFSVPLQSFGIYESQENFNNYCLDALKNLKGVKELCADFKFEFNENFSQVSNVSGEMYVKNNLSEIQSQMEELGEYGGSIATLAAFKPLVRLYSFCDGGPRSATKLMLSHLVCTLAKIRKIYEDDMFRVQLCERAERFSSKKVQLLLNHLKDMPKSHRALVVVNDPNTASNLTLILQKVVSQGRKHHHIKPELMVNCSYDPLSDSWEDTLSWERNMDILFRFISGETNTVILSGKPKGSDLPICNLVLVWDKVENFSDYMQVKNYTKSGTGQLFLLVDKSNLDSYADKIRNLETMEIDLKKILCEESEGDAESSTSEVMKTSLGKEIKADSAISVLNRYCKTLAGDMFTSCCPFWKMEKHPPDSLLYCVSLHLPRSSPVNNVKSLKLPSWQAAKQNAALQACQKLLKAGVLNDTMISPYSNSCSKESQSEINNQCNADFQLSFESKLGFCDLRSAAQKGTSYSDDEDILCNIMYPQSLTSALPRYNAETYVHRLNIAPVSEAPPRGDNRKVVLYELLCDKSTFAILSSKPLLEVCQFPVFLFGHELAVNIETLNSHLLLSSHEILRLMRFHHGLFIKVLPIVQNFMQFDMSNVQNSYLIAPLTAEGEIDWNIVDNHTSIPECRKLTHEEKMNLVCTPETHERTMVKPWYRHLSKDQVYLVSEVCTDMSAESCFPTEDFDSFLDYYREKYKIILERPELPLLEAYLVNTKVKGLLPRSRTAKLRREEKMEDFREHMVPELCMPLLFPAAMWLKLSSLPSVLHRLHRLLVVEDFRRKLIDETGVGSVKIDFQNLTVDISCLMDGPSGQQVPPSIVKRGLAIGNVKLEDRKRRAQLKKPWRDNQEPVDIHRHMESLNFVEIRYFDEYLIKSRFNHSSSPSHGSAVEQWTLEDSDSDSDSSFSRNTPSPGPEGIISETKKDELPEYISLLDHCGNENNHGPQLHELLEVFTSACSSDAVCMDRLQILGNAVLNLTISVFAYKYGLKIAGSCTSSCLQSLRTAFMDTNHLERCSIRQQICNRIKVLDFVPEEWIPPCFATPQMLKDVLKEQEISPNVLQQIQLTEEEQFAGVISDETENEILDLLTAFENRGSSRREEGFIDQQLVPSITAASCVEALVGIYFKNCGWHGALKIIGWLQLIPSNNLESLLEYEEPEENASVGAKSTHAPKSLQSLELSLKYKFHDTKLLVQALTHESYVDSSFHGDLTTLAFLGSGVLDFLLTCYIHEHFMELRPTQMCRLREILSSTSTLAYLAVLHGIHKYLFSNSPALLDAVDRFIKLQKGCKEAINDEVQLLLEEHECHSVLQVEVPDALAKLLPALAGAVYLDCGKNLSVVWNIFRGIFIPELGIWREDIPLSTLELLKDLSPAAHQVIFSSKTSADRRVEVTCKILMDNTREEVFVAYGCDESKAKTHAAKLALRNLLGNNFCY